MARSPDVQAASAAYGTPDVPVRWTGRVVTGALIGVVVPLLIAHFGVNARGLISAFFATVLIVLSAIDLERRIIPNRIVLPAAAAVLAAQILFFHDHAFEWIAASIGAGVFLLIPSAMRPGALGMGDVKLALLLGAGLGRHVVTALLLGFFALWPIVFFLLLRHGVAAARKTAVPLGPFLALGSIVTLFLN